MRVRARAPVEAHEAIQRLLIHPRGLVLTHHARQKMQERGISLDDLVSVLTRGTLGSKPEWNTRAGTWQYQVAGRDCDGDPLTVHVAIEDAIIVITSHA
jgi:Domain of unknown function (DUF4258)